MADPTDKVGRLGLLIVSSSIKGFFMKWANRSLYRFWYRSARTVCGPNAVDPGSARPILPIHRLTSPRTFFLSFLFLWGTLQADAAQTTLPGFDRTNALDNTVVFPRAAAMGSAFTGVADDASALFSNPSGLALLEEGQLSFNNDIWLVGTFQATALLGMPLQGWGGMGLAVKYLDFGTFEGRDGAGALTPSYGANRWAIQAGWGIGVLKDLYLGIGLEDSQAFLAGIGSNHLSSNVGLLWKSRSGFGLGASYVNVGFISPGGLNADAINLGASYSKDLDSRTHFLVALGGTLQPDGIQYLQAGTEWNFLKGFFLRAGYQLPLSDMGLVGLTGLTAGAGVRVSGFDLDYAYLPYGDLGSAHRISVGYQFDSPHGPLPAVVRPVLPALPTVTPIASTPTLPVAATAQGTSQPRPSNGAGDKDSLIVQFEDPDEANGASANAGWIDPRKKLEQCLAAVKTAPRDPVAWWSLGNAYRDIQRKDYAIQCYDQVLKLQPGNRKFEDWLKKYKAVKP